MKYLQPMAIDHIDGMELFTGLNKSVNNSTSHTNDLPEDDANIFWERAIAVLQPRITSQHFELWFRPIRCVSILGEQITLAAPNRFLRDWFADHYLSLVLAEMPMVPTKNWQVLWLIDERLPWPSLPPASSLSEELVPPPPNNTVSLPEAPKTPASCRDLLPRYTFDTFVTGPSNQLAEAASRSVAHAPGGKYNPLFLYGGVGLGKTHLLHAIGHIIHQQHPTWRIVYVKTETFLNEYIHLVRHQRIDEFRNKYRNQVDVLLMDDIQYLGGKERTQDEFFHTFNALFEAGKQIVVTADKYPHQIQDLEERVRSRFQWGLIADIHPPELETRMAILLRKAEYEKISLSADVAAFLAEHIRSNVRELEGLLLRLAASASLQHAGITVDFAKKTLQQFFASKPISNTIQAIQERVAAFAKISLEDLKGSKRHKSIARARQMAMYLARKWCKVSYPDIAAQFGGKDHTTVLAACRKIESLLNIDPQLRQEIADIEKRFQ